MPVRKPSSSIRDWRTSRAFGAVPVTAPPIDADAPSPRTEPATWVPCPSRSSVRAGLLRPRAIRRLTRPLKAGCR